MRGYRVHRGGLGGLFKWGLLGVCVFGLGYSIGSDRDRGRSEGVRFTDGGAYFEAVKEWPIKDRRGREFVRIFK
jgi:hypothetical protein